MDRSGTGHSAELQSGLSASTVLPYTSTTGHEVPINKHV